MTTLFKLSFRTALKTACAAFLFCAATVFVAAGQTFTLQEAVVAGTGTAAAGSISTGSVGQPATARSAGTDGSIEPDHHGVEPGDRAASREVSAGAATDDASRSRGLNRAGFCAHHRPSRPLRLRQAGGELSGAGAVGGLQRQSTTPGAHHQTGKLDDAFLAGGSGPGDGAQPARVAQQISPLDDAARTENR